MRAFFTNELGEGHGHLAPSAALLESLADEGWEIVAAVRDTAAAVPLLAECKATILQAPVCVAQFDGIPEEELDYNEILFKSGYAHQPTLTGLLSAWLALFKLVKPDILITNASPTALLAAHCLGIPAMRIATGWNCPPPVEPLPLFRPWAPEVDQRREASHRLAQATVNASLRACGYPALESLTALHKVSTVLTTYPELDPYAAVRKDVTYVGLLPAGRGARKAGATPDCDVFAYIRVTALTDMLLTALRGLPVKSAAWVADLGEAERVTRTAANLELLDRPADLDAVLERAKVVIGYGSHGLIAAALRAGKPLLMLPMHQEQYLNAKRVEDAGAGIIVGPWEKKPKLARLLRSLLEEPRYAANARALGERLGMQDPGAALRRAREVCKTLAPGHEPRLRSVG